MKVSQEQVVLAVTAVLVVVFAALMPSFRTASNAIILLQNTAVLGILAIGMAIVIIAKGIDLSLVAIMAVTAGLTVYLTREGYGELSALAIGLALALLLGALNGVLIAYVEVPALFVTLATSILFLNGARTFLYSELRQYVPPEAGFVTVLGQARPFGIPLPVIIFLALAGIVHLMLARTPLGRFIYAQGDNGDGAALTGIPTRPLTVIEYGLSALIGYIAGLVYSGQAASMDLSIVLGNLIFTVILVAVLGGVSLVGGRGGVKSVIAGTLLVGVAVNAMTLANIDNNIQTIVLGMILLGAILLDNKLHPRDEETARQGD